MERSEREKRLRFGEMESRSDEDCPREMGEESEHTEESGEKRVRAREEVEI